MFQGNGFQSNAFQIGSVLDAIGAAAAVIYQFFRNRRRRR
jgi:hypothetical protein